MNIALARKIVRIGDDDDQLRKDKLCALKDLSFAIEERDINIYWFDQLEKARLYVAAYNEAKSND